MSGRGKGGKGLGKYASPTFHCYESQSTDVEFVEAARSVTARFFATTSRVLPSLLFVVSLAVVV